MGGQEKRVGGWVAKRRGWEGEGGRERAGGRGREGEGGRERVRGRG